MLRTKNLGEGLTGKTKRKYTDDACGKEGGGGGRECCRGRHQRRVPGAKKHKKRSGRKQMTSGVGRKNGIDCMAGEEWAMETITVGRSKGKKREKELGRVEITASKWKWQ